MLPDDHEVNFTLQYMSSSWRCNTKFFPTILFGCPTADLKSSKESDSISSILPTAHRVPIGLLFLSALFSLAILNIWPPSLPLVIHTLSDILSWLDAWSGSAPSAFSKVSKSPFQTVKLVSLMSTFSVSSSLHEIVKNSI